MLVDRPDFLDVLAQQSVQGAEVVSWDDAAWVDRVAGIAGAQGWIHLRADSREHALAVATGAYIVGWGASHAAPNALEALRQASADDPSKRGALTANFDPLVFWRRDAFTGDVVRRGLVQADVYALGGGLGTNVHPHL
ncbi:MAG: hypothetical protein ACR2MO_08160 [Acidimicrobiales bacterium]